tara:strand:- start:1971 stop:2090 length:120 start_codon:yes stop_codon:yes gene_type:complete
VAEIVEIALYEHLCKLCVTMEREYKKGKKINNSKRKNND